MTHLNVNHQENLVNTLSLKENLMSQYTPTKVKTKGNVLMADMSSMLCDRSCDFWLNEGEDMDSSAMRK